ncbi:MAG TPA: 5'-3' exonuclease H3TH domain-containing protein [Polyangia bacterium]|nr:5'-3' exonuclease H3TH domain-containing protein [Polyangia bacterium]
MAPAREDEDEVLLLDAFALVYRAFFALPAMVTSRGEPTGALYGFSVLLLKLLRERRPKGISAGLDAPAATFRHAAFAGYKASRPRAPTPLGQQLRRLPALLDAFGATSFSVPGFEADDVLATLARELAGAGERPLVVTGDLDALQCARDSTRVYVVGRGATAGRLYDEAAVWERFSVTPAELPDWKALVGDVTDEIPGVPGVGPQRAAQLVRRFGDVAGVLAGLNEIKPPALRDAIAARAGDLALWKDLARLRDDVPLPARARFGAFDATARARLRTLFEELEFRSLLPRLDALPL